LLGFLLDLKMRAVSQNQTSLDDLMRYLNLKYAKNHKGYGNGALEKAIAELTSCNFFDFFQDYVYGTNELPFDRYLEYGGLKLDYQTFDINTIGDLFFVGPDNRVISVPESSPAALAGLQKNDRVQRLNKTTISSLYQFRQLIRAMDSDRECVLTVFRPVTNDTIEIHVTPGLKQDVECEIYEAEAPDLLQAAVRNGLLQGTVSETVH
jgi:predicted metalloprotease with PDZ domain